MPEQAHWPKVRDAIFERMRSRGVDEPELSRRTRLAPNTLSSVLMAKGTSNESTLVAISAVLGWPYDYLINILHGEPHKNVPTESPAEQGLRRAIRPRLKALNDEIAKLNGILDEDGQVTKGIVDSQHPLDDQ